MALTKIQSGSFETGAIDTSDLSSNATIAFSSTSAFANALAPKITTVNVANSAFTVLDDTAVNIGGGYVVITGANFQSGASVLIDTTPASAVTFVNTSTLQVQIPAKAAASYNLYVVNPDGGTGIRIAGLNYSAEPSWVTSSPLSNQNANTAFNVTLSATGATSYSVAAGSTLPAGTTLLANGYFSGTVTIGAETTYTFSVVATDAENQDSSKTFQVTVTVAPQLKLFAWGKNSGGELGLNDVVFRSSPTQVGSGTTWSSLGGVTNYASAAIKTDGTLWTWGSGIYDQLGHNNTVNRSSPTQVGSSTTWSKVCNAAYTFLAIKTDGTLWTWGYGARGVSGLNDQVYRSSPTQVGSATNWSKLPVGNNIFFTGAIKTDGTLWTWGTNSVGQLGVNDLTYRSSPTQVGTGTDWNILGGGGAFGAVAIKTNGTLWTWGNESSGQLGQGDAVRRSSPTQVGSATTWSKVQSYNDRVTAIKTDGTLWAWGANSDGQLGLNDRVNRSIPAQVGVATNWSVASIANRMAGGIKTDGTLWMWGNGEEFSGGALGLNDNVIRSSPTQVGAGTTWLDLNVGYRVLALRT